MTAVSIKLSTPPNPMKTKTLTQTPTQRSRLLVDFFAFLTFLMVGVGFSLIGITGQMAFPSYFLFLVPFLGHGIRPIRERLQLSST